MISPLSMFLLSCCCYCAFAAAAAAGRYVIDSRPILFQEESSAALNSTSSIGPTYFNTKKPVFQSVSNHHVPNGGEDQVVWRPPPHMTEEVISNHKGTSHWHQKWFHRASSTPSPINNHQSSVPTDVLGGRVKRPDVVHSATLHVLDAPTHLKTTVKKVQDSQIIVIQKRTDKLSSPGGKPSFSVAPVMDQPTWSQPTVSQRPPVLPPPFSLLVPLLSKPLTPSAMNSGMQGIKAMQGFLRNSLMGALFCFLPSAFIALSLTATQRTEVRKTPEMDDMIFYCKKCLENLKKIKEFVQSKDPNWLNENS